MKKITLLLLVGFVAMFAQAGVLNQDKAAKLQNVKANVAVKADGDIVTPPAGAEQMLYNFQGHDTYTNKDNTLMRRDLILKAMLKDGYITKDQYDQAVTEEIKIKKKKKVKVNSVDSFVMDCATKSLMKVRGFDFKYSFDSDVEKDLYNSEYNEIYNQCQASLYTNGYRIYTSIDPAKQKLLQATVDEKMAPFTDTYGDEEKVYDMQATATCIDNSTGRVVAIVGGRSQKLEGYTLNRAFQSYRQPGSSIKPVIVYTPALERGYTPDTIVVDKQLKEKDAPKNSSGGYRGKMKLRNAVEASLNTVAWQVYKDVTPERGIQYLLNMHYNKIASTDYVMATAVGGLHMVPIH
jgi:membrane peptidoglycan carboxypeptidase